MRIKPFLTTLVGVALAGGAVFYAKEQLIDPNGAAIALQGPDMVEVVVARSEIDFGQPIDSTMLATQSWPATAAPPNSFREIAALLPNPTDGPRRARGHFFKGEVILATKVSAYGDKVTIVQKLGDNTRAMAIKVDATTAVGGFVTPGDYVDIVLTQGKSIELSAVTILQNIRVIGVDQSSEELKDNPGIAKTITVEVTPDQGQRLALAQKAGTLSLTLRSQATAKDKPLDMVRLSDLLSEVSPLDEGERAPTITIRRGTTSEEISLK